MVAVVTALVVVALGAAAGIGVVLSVLGLLGSTVIGAPGSPWGQSVDRLALRLGLAVGSGVLAAWWTGWPVAAFTAGGLGAWLPSTFDRRGQHHDELDVVEAIATWIEQLRDTLAAANGLEHAIVATSPLAPAALAPAVRRLASRVEVQQLERGLREFALEVDHPLADFVVAALVTAGRHQAREIAALLGHLSSCAREDAAMRRRIWVGRARSRSAVRIILAVVAIFVGGLLLLDDTYLAPYETLDGQMVLTAVIGLFAGSVLAMARMGRLSEPDRFIGRRIEAGG